MRQKENRYKLSSSNFKKKDGKQALGEENILKITWTLFGVLETKTNTAKTNNGLFWDKWFWL